MPTAISATENTATAPDAHLWNRVKTDLRTLFPEDIYEMWFAPMAHIENTDDTLTLSVATDFAAIWINDNYTDLIAQRLHLHTGHPVQLKLRKTTPLAPNPEPIDNNPRQTAANNNPAPNRKSRIQTPKSPAPVGLNPNNTFENYIVGPNNTLAHAAALAVTQAPGQAYNPLFIYGDTGLGKTHLMHAIGHAIHTQNPKATIACITAEKFTNDYIQAIRENTFSKFRQHYRQIDILILDDIQFLSGKEGVQEEFFHTFNDLHNHGKQIVLSSDRRAAEIQKLEDRLITRLQWGLTTDIQAPDYETRLAILNTKARQLRYELPAPIAEFIARNITKNIRALEGALLKIASYATLTRQTLDQTKAEELLKDTLIENAQNALTIETIQKVVSEHYQISRADMLGKKRPREIAYPRQVAMYLIRQHTKHSLQEIGNAFGGRDHGTVIHAIKTVEAITAQDTSAKGTLDLLNQKLKK